MWHHEHHGCYHELNKNAVDKSYFVEFSENLTTFVV